MIDTFELNVSRLDEAHKFLHTYGLENRDYAEQLRKTAFEYLETVLLREGNLSARIYDHIGVRFVTNDIFSAILLIKFFRS